MPNADGAAWTSVIQWTLSRLAWYRVDYPVDPCGCFHDSAPVRYGFAALGDLPAAQERRCGSREIIEGPARAPAFELLARLCKYPFDDDHYIHPGESLMAYYLTTTDGTIVELRYFYWLLINPSDDFVAADLTERIIAAGTKKWTPRRPQRRDRSEA